MDNTFHLGCTSQECFILTETEVKATCFCNMIKASDEIYGNELSQRISEHFY